MKMTGRSTLQKLLDKLLTNLRLANKDWPGAAHYFLSPAWPGARIFLEMLAREKPCRPMHASIIRVAGSRNAPLL